MDNYAPLMARQRLADLLGGNSASPGLDPSFMNLMQMLTGGGINGNGVGSPGTSPYDAALNSPYGRGWGALQQAYSSDNIAALLGDYTNSLGTNIPELLGNESPSGGGGSAGGGNGGGGRGYSGSGAYGEGSAGGGGGWAYPAANLDSRFGYGPDESANDPSARDPFSAQFRIPASFASQFPPGTDVYEQYYNEVYAPQIAKNPMTKIPAWAWKYAIDAEGRGYPPGSYGQKSDGTWVTPDGIDPLGVDTGQYSMDAFGKNPPGQDTGPGSPGADFDFSKYPFPGGPPNGKAPAVGGHVVGSQAEPGHGGFTGSGAGGGPAVRRRGGNRQGQWAGPARRPNHPNGGFQANGATAFGGGGRNVPAGGGNSFPGGGYAAPGQINRGLSSGQPDRIRTEPDWSRHADRRTGGGNNDVVRTSDNGRRVRYEDGTVVRQPKERERVRVREDENGNSTKVTVSRNGGTVISNQSGGDGNRGRNAGNGGNANASADRQRVVSQAQQAARNGNGGGNRNDDKRRDDERNKKRK